MADVRPPRHRRAQRTGRNPHAGPDNLIAKPVTPGDDDAGAPTAAPGTYEADEAEQERGKAVKPGN